VQDEPQRPPELPADDLDQLLAVLAGILLGTNVRREGRGGMIRGRNMVFCAVALSFVAGDYRHDGDLRALATVGSGT
jgi:hypothetical protein